MNVNFIIENVIQINSGIMMNINVSVNILNNICVQKNYIWNTATCNCENSKYVGSVTDNSIIRCDEIIEEIKTIQTNFNEER